MTTTAGVRSPVDRFAVLFRGNPSYHITCNPQLPKDKQVITRKAEYTLAEMQAHLAGSMGLGTSPLLPDHTCVFGGIDIDVRDGVPVSLTAIVARVADAHFPLVVCRSRSGGAHLYVFFRRPAPASRVRALLGKWAAKLQIEGTDCIIPAADFQQIDVDGRPHISRSFNLPYLGGDATDRYAIARDGVTQLTLAGFLDLAEASLVEPSMVMELPSTDYDQAPPCVQRLIDEGIPAGLRNEALTQIAIYQRRREPELDPLPALLDYNARLVDPPLKQDEVKKIAKSINRRDYHYRCKIEPCKSLCNSAVCVTRKYGITRSEGRDNQASDVLADITFDDICRVQNTADGGVYKLSINGHAATVAATRLFSVSGARILLAESFHLVLPGAVGHNKWVDFITPLVASAREQITAPEVDTESGAIGEQLDEFIAGRLAKTPDGADADATMMHRGRLKVSPILEEGSVVLRMQTFIRFCRDRRMRLPPENDIANLMRKLGWEHKRLRTPDGVVPVWFIPHNKATHDQTYDELPAPDPNSDY